MAKRLLGGQAITVSALREHCGEHVFGRLPTGRTLAPIIRSQGEDRSMTDPNRRDIIAGATALGLTALMRTPAMGQTATPDLILINGKFTTLDRSNPAPQAVAITGGRFSAVGDAADVMAAKGPSTRVIDLGGRRAIPGLCDNHIHVIRGGLNFNMELRWDGVSSLADAMDMLRRQVANTPAPQWVRVVGGFTEHQFAEKRLPTLEEINRAAPDTPVFILHLYDRALLNARRPAGHRLHQGHQGPARRHHRAGRPGQPDRPADRQPQRRPPLFDARQGAEAAVRVSGELDPALHARPQPARRDQRDRRRRRLSRTTRRITRSSNRLHKDGELTLRIAYNLFTQKPKEEKEDFLRWTSQSKYQQGDDYFRLNGAGEMLVYSAADFEDFRVERPDMPPEMEGELEQVVRVLAAEPLALAAARHL